MGSFVKSVAKLQKKSHIRKSMQDFFERLAELFSICLLGSLLGSFLCGLLLGFHRSFQFCQSRKVTESGLLHLRHLYLRLFRFSGFLGCLSRSLFCTSSHVRARTEDTLSVTTSLNHLERQFVANIPHAIKKRKKTPPQPPTKKWVLPSSSGVHSYNLFIYGSSVFYSQLPGEVIFFNKSKVYRLSL